MTDNPKSVLLVEDSKEEAMLINMVARKVPALQFVATARNGEEAISYVAGAGIYRDRQKYPMPDAIILDWKMPGLNGFDVLKWLRDRPERPLVVVFTGSTDEDDRRRALALGADEFRVKPVDFRELEGFLIWLLHWIGDDSKSHCLSARLH